jgi:hypothetical protein
MVDESAHREVLANDRHIDGGTGHAESLLALYRAHPDYGDRSTASRIAAELAAQAGLQPGTARSYLYAELVRRPS